MKAEFNEEEVSRSERWAIRVLFIGVVVILVILYFILK